MYLFDVGAIEPCDNMGNAPSAGEISYGTFAMFDYEKKKPVFLPDTSNQ